MADAALALRPPQDTEAVDDAAPDVTADVSPAAPDLGTVTPKSTPLPNPFEGPSTLGLDKALDMVMGNYDQNQAIGKEQDAYVKRLGKVEQDYEANQPRRQELLGRLKVPQAAPAPQMQERSPIEAIGSLGAVVGAFGSLFSRRPMTAAFKSMAAGMDALKQNDIDTFGRNYKTWKDETDLALKQADLENGIVKTILDDDSKTWDQKLNLFKAYGGALNDKLLVQNAQAGNVRDIIGINEKKISLAERMRESVASMKPENLIMWNYRNTFQQQNGRPPNEKEEISELARLKPELARDERLREILDKDPDWKSEDPQRSARALQRANAAVAGFSSSMMGNPQEVVVGDGKGGTKVVTAQQNKMTGEWVTADEKREPVSGVLRVLTSAERTSQGSELKPDTAKALAERFLAGDKSAAQNLGRGTQGAKNWTIFQDAVSDAMKDRGYTGADVAVKMAEFEGLKAAERALGTRTATFGMAVSEARSMMDQVRETSDAVTRTDYPKLNQIILAGERGTGETAVVNFGIALNSLINTYARAINPTGASTVSDKEHARELLSENWSKGQINSALEQLGKELDAAGRAPGMVKEELRSGATGRAPAASGPKDGEKGTSKSGRPTIFRNGKWEYQ